MTKSGKFGFEQSVNFFREHAGDTYILPEKAGADKERMLSLKQDAREARYNFIEFAKQLSKEFTDLKYDNADRCSRWCRDNGKGKPKIIHFYFWIQ